MMVLTKHPVGVEKRLIEVLTRIWDNTNFILGVRACLQTDEERQWVLDAIEDEEVTNPGDILLYAVDIYTDREATLK